MKAEGVEVETMLIFPATCQIHQEMRNCYLFIFLGGGGRDERSHIFTKKVPAVAFFHGEQIKMEVIPVFLVSELWRRRGILPVSNEKIINKLENNEKKNLLPSTI